LKIGNRERGIGEGGKEGRREEGFSFFVVNSRSWTTVLKGSPDEKIS
jgi:hypothetical protein